MDLKTYREIRDREFVGRKVKTLVQMRNNLCVIPPGTIATVQRKFNGLYLLTGLVVLRFISQKSDREMWILWTRPNCQKQLKREDEGTMEKPILSSQILEIIMDADLSVYDKGKLLSDFIKEFPEWKDIAKGLWRKKYEHGSYQYSFEKYVERHL
ncbi:MAG: hypothetical protein Q7R34_06395 [Dehalococcoidia bacterium]|nr:hypothetical protein [Dehalococcoidia bacterium]